MQNGPKRFMITVELRHADSDELIKRFSGERGWRELGRGGHRADPSELGLSTGLLRREGTQVMSTKHAVIQWDLLRSSSDEDPGYVPYSAMVEIMDLGSTNGTCLRRRGESEATRLKPQKLHRILDGDVLTFGKQLMADGTKNVHRPLTLKVKIIESEIGAGDSAGDQDHAGASAVDGSSNIVRSSSPTQGKLDHGQTNRSPQQDSDTESDQYGSGAEEVEQTMVITPKTPIESSRQPPCKGYGITEEQLVLHDEESIASDDKAPFANPTANSKLGMSISAIDLTKEESGSDRDSVTSDLPRSDITDRGSQASGLQQTHGSDHPKVAKQELGIVMFSDEAMDEYVDDPSRHSHDYVTDHCDLYSEKSDGDESSRSYDSDEGCSMCGSYSDDEESDKDASDSGSDGYSLNDGSHISWGSDRSTPYNSDCEEASSQIYNATSPTQRGQSGAIRVDERRRVVLSSEDEEDDNHDEGSPFQSSSRGVTTPPSSSVLKPSSPLQSHTQPGSNAVDDGQDLDSVLACASEVESEKEFDQASPRSSPLPLASDHESDPASQHDDDQDADTLFSGIPHGSLALNTHAKNLKDSLEAMDRLLKIIGGDKKLAEDGTEALSGPDTSGADIGGSENATASLEPTTPAVDTSAMDKSAEMSLMRTHTEIVMAPSPEVVAPFKAPRFVRVASTDVQAEERAKTESVGPPLPIFLLSDSDVEVDPDLDEIDPFVEGQDKTDSGSGITGGGRDSSSDLEEHECDMGTTKSFDTPRRVFEGILTQDGGAAHKPSRFHEHLSASLTSTVKRKTNLEGVQPTTSKKRAFSVMEASDEADLRDAEGQDTPPSTSSDNADSEAITTAERSPPQSSVPASDESTPATKRRRVNLRDVSLGFGVGVIATLWGLTAMSESFLQSIIE